MAASEWSQCSASSHMEPSPRRGGNAHHHDGLLGQAQRQLQHQISRGNSVFKSIDAAWLEQHQELLETFLSNPNDPAILEAMPPITDDMDLDLGVCQPAASCELSRLGSAPEPAPEPQRERAPVTTGFRAGSPVSPVLDTPRLQAQAKPAQSARPTRSSARAEALAPARSSGTLDRRAGLVPEVSLAARAGSLGATSLTSSQRAALGARGGAGAAAALLRSSDSEGAGPSQIPDMPEEEAAPERRGPGRKKRTKPMLVETEDGEMKWVTPAEFRKLRRRITNRLSARRMRKKHADERQTVKDATSALEEERDMYRDECHALQSQLEQLSQRYHALEDAFRQLQAQAGPLQHGYLGSLPPGPEQLDLQPLSLAPFGQGEAAGGLRAEAAFRDANAHLAMPSIPPLAEPGDLAAAQLAGLLPSQPLTRRQSARILSGRPILE